MENAVVSIITVCFNAERHIEETINSVLAQHYPGIEYIIVDGSSTDGTMQIVRKYTDRIAVVISEPDKGLYDAMNKGLRLAKGDYVLFLNADDTLYSPDILTKVFAHCGEADAIYGEAMFMNEAGETLGLRSKQTPHKTPQHLNWNSLRYGMTVSHQAFIIRRSLAETYDLRYAICADIDWMIRCLKACKSVCNTKLTISKFRTGGTSKQRQKQAWKERYQILKKHYGAVPNLFNHGYIAARYLFSQKY